MQFDFSPNPNAKIETMYVGNEKQPVLIVDDCLLHPESAVEYAATSVQFSPPRHMYPGVVGPAPREYALSLLNVIAPKLRDVFNVPIEKTQVTSFYALTITPPEQLNIGQRLPHIDTPDPNQIAVLHYLCDAKHGGTAFYRHRATGYESCTQPQFMEVVKSLEQDAAVNGPLPAEYVTGSNRLYEQTASIDAKFNRVLMYRSQLLHSGSINAQALSPDPRVGRLTANTFLTFK